MIGSAVRFSLAGASFRLESADPSTLDPVRPLLSPFAARSAPDLELEIVPIERAADEAALELPWLVRSADGAFSLRTAWCEGEGDREGRRWRLRTAPSVTAISAVLKILIADWLARRGGLLVHAVAVASEAGAALFPGRSGAGKSTLGALAEAGGLHRLSDELVALRPSAQGWTAHATPWNIGRPRAAPLIAVGLLAHAPAHRLDDAPASEVLRELVPNVVLTEPGPRARAEAFRRAARLLGAVRTARLHFARDTGVADVLKLALF